MLVNTGFQVLFHSPPGVLFTFPSQYFFAIDHWVVFRLRGWSPCLHTGFLVSRTTPDTAGLLPLRILDSHLLRSAFPHRSARVRFPYAVHTPKVLLPSVWPLPISLATTFGISFDFSSSAYLDVSVRQVPSL